jgi:hypothetical protein
MSDQLAACESRADIPCRGGCLPPANSAACPGLMAAFRRQRQSDAVVQHDRFAAKQPSADGSRDNRGVPAGGQLERAADFHSDPPEDWIDRGVHFADIHSCTTTLVQA